MIKLIWIVINILLTYWSKNRFMPKQPNENTQEKSIRCGITVLIFILFLEITYAILYFGVLLYFYMEERDLLPPSFFSVFEYIMRNVLNY